MKMYLATWEYECTITPVEIIRKTDTSVWVFQNGKERERSIKLNDSMYCMTYELAREKIIYEKSEYIRVHKMRLAYIECMLNVFIEKTSNNES